MVGLACSVKERGGDVFRLEKWVVAQDLLMRGTGGEKLEQIHHAKAGAADTRASATFAGFDGDAFEWFHGGRLLRGGGFCEHGFQLTHPVNDFLFQVRKRGENFTRRAVRHFGVDHFLVAIEREVVALRDKVGLRHAEALRSAGAREFATVRRWVFGGLPFRGRAGYP